MEPGDAFNRRLFENVLHETERPKLLPTKDLWADFERQVVPVNTPAEVRRLLRQAFYGGVWGLFTELFRTEPAGGYKLVAGVQQLDGYVADRDAFDRDVLEGRA